MSLISVKHLCKSFGSIQPLADVSFELQPGEAISIIGPSGTGKSTLLRCLNRLEQPTKGEIIVDGENILDDAVDLNRVRQKMGMVLQSFNLFSHLMVIENVMIGPVQLKGVERQTAYEKGMELLRMVGMAEKAFSYPDELSGGQKQRVAIARTLSMEPKIILFDEPTSALDPTMVGEVVSVIRRLVEQGMTMMVVTHEMKLARDISSRIFYMDEGIIYEEGTPQQIFDAPQKEKTRLFVRQLKPFRAVIQSKDFDFLGINGEMTRFMQQQLVPEQIGYSCQSLFEELFLQCILPHLPKQFNAALELGWSERNITMDFCLRYDGDAYDPLTDAANDELALFLVHRAAPQLRYRYEGQMNYLEGTLAQDKS